MADVEGSTPEDLEQQATLIEEAVAAALAVVAAHAAAGVLGAVPAFVGTAVAAAPWVSLDDVATVPTMWLRQVDDTAVPLLRGILDEQAEDVREQIQTVVDAQPGIYGVPSLTPGEPPVVPTVPHIPNVTSDQLMAQARNRLVGIGDLLWLDIRQQLTEGIAAGETVEQLAKRVGATAGVAEPRARVIARTETIAVSNGASIAQARSAGFPMRKTWLATDDERTRLWHVEADNQTVGLDDLFEVGPDYLDVPGDPAGSASNVISCRCGIGFTLLGLPTPVTAAVGRKTAADPYVRDADGQFAKTGTPDFAKMKVTDLRAELKRRGVEGLSKANKAQLVEALQQFDNATGRPTEPERVEPPKTPKPRTPKTTTPVAEKSPDVLQAEEHAKELTKSLPASVRKEVLDSLIQQAAVKPRSVRTLKGFEFRDLGSGGAQYLPDQRTIAINSRWKTNKRAMTAAGKASLEDGFLTPTGANSVLGAYIAHEFGHHVAFGRYSPSGPGLVKPFGDRVMQALSRAIGVSGAPPSRGANIRWPDVASWMARNRKKLQTEVSEYGAESFHELLAELWQEYSTRGEKARPAAKAVGPVLQGATAPSANAHLQGQHDQRDHGRKGPRKPDAEVSERTRARRRNADRERRDIERQARQQAAEEVNMQAARAMAELAIEFEEMIAKGASQRAMTHRVRAAMRRLRLEPSQERAGDVVPFDRGRHQPIGGDIADGVTVQVLRPGYVWRQPGREVLIERPVVLPVGDALTTAGVGRKTADDPYVRDSEGQFAKTGTPDLSKMKVPELRAEAKRRGLKGLSKASKAQLVDALKTVANQTPSSPNTSESKPFRDLTKDAVTALEIVRRVEQQPGVKRRWGSLQHDSGSDPVFVELARELGIDGPTQTVSRGEFAKLVKDGTIGSVMYRGVQSTPDKSAMDIMEEFRSGPLFGGLGTFGNGTYMASGRSHARAYGDGTRGSVAKFGLRRDANVITYRDLAQEFDQWHDEMFGKNATWEEYQGHPEYDVFGEMGRFAMARGYDAILIPAGQSPGIGMPAAGEQYSILNRKAIISEAPDAA